MTDGDVYHRGRADQDGAALRGSGEQVAFKGKGRVQAGMLGDELHLRVDALTTQTRRFKSLIGDFFRLEFKRARPKWGPYEVTIVIERTEDSPKHDVDNVAKAVLDALSGVVFHDDSQVEKLLVRKVMGDRARVRVTARPLSGD